MNIVKNQIFSRDIIQKVGLFIFLFLFALALRIHGLDFESLFMDEVRQVGYYNNSFFNMITFSMEQQQPPLDYWIGHLFFLINNSDFMARLPAAIFGSFSVLLLASLLSRHVSLWLALAMAIIFSLLPFNLYFSQDARPYSISIFFCLQFIWLIDYIYNLDRIYLKHYGLLLIVTTMFLLTRALSPLVVITVTIFFFFSWLILDIVRNGVIKNKLQVKLFFITLTLTLSCIIYLPVLLQIISYGGRYAHGGASIGLDFFIEGFNSFKIEPMWEAYITQAEPLGFIMAILIPIGLFFLLLRQKSNSFLLFFTLFLLIGSVFLHSFVFHAKTTLPLRPPYAIYLLPLVFIIFSLIFEQSVKLAGSLKNIHSIAKILIVILLLLTFPSSIDFKNKRTKTDWRALSEYIMQTHTKEQLLLFKAFTDEGDWDPSYYGFNRYSMGTGDVNWLPMRIFEKQFLRIRNLFLNPQVIIFQYRDYNLTNNSSYPIISKSTPRTEIDLVSVLDTNKLMVKSFTGVTVVSLKNSSGNLLVDTKFLFQELLTKLPKDSSIGDMYHIYAMSLAACGEYNYSEILNIADQISIKFKITHKQREFIDKVYQQAKLQNTSCAIRKKI